MSLAAAAALLFTLLAPAPGSAASIPVVFTWGDRISDVGDVTGANKALLSRAARDARRADVMTRVGYKYRYVGVFWISFFNWSGSYCLYQGTRYVRISTEAAAALTGMDGLHPPWLYRIPLGWILVGGPLAFIFLVGGILQARENAKIKRLRQDARYQRALEIVRTTMTAAMARETATRQHYEERSRGIRSTTHPRGVAGIWIVDPGTTLEREWLDDGQDGIAARQIRTPGDAVGARGAIAGTDFRIDGVLQVSDERIVYQLTNVQTGTFVAYGFSGDLCQAPSVAAT